MSNGVFFDLKNRCLKANIKEYREGVYEEIHDDLVDIFGDDYRKKFDISAGYDKGAWSCSDYPAFWAIQLALAKHGMAHSLYYATLGYRLGYGSAVKWQIEMLKKIESYVIEAHPELSPSDLQLCLKPKTLAVWNDIKRQAVTVKVAKDVENGTVLCRRFCPDGRRLW